MSTLGELKARVADELNRTDLTTQIASAVNRAISFYATKRFLFNQGRKTAVTTAGSSDVAYPAGLRSVDRAFVTVGGSAWDLYRITPSEIEDWLLGSATSGQPTDYADYGTSIRLYPTPNAAYTLTFVGSVDLTALSTDTSTNAWTTEGEDLIVARAKFTLARDLLMAPEMAAAARQAETEALNRLRSEASDRMGTGMIKPSF